MAQPSKYLTWSEIACKDGTPYPYDFIQEGRLHQLVTMFENIRNIYNKPLIVLSAFRTPEWNKKIGGAKHSQHVQGRALDLKPPKGVSVTTFYNDVKSFAKLFGIHGLGQYQTFIHVDFRPIEDIVYWSSDLKKDS